VLEFLQFRIFKWF